MKIAWIQDNSRPHGGAETSNRCVVGVGENIGFDIVGVTPENFHASVLRECDVAIVNNFFEFTPDQKRTVMGVLWDEGKPYVKYEHDSREMHRPEFSEELFRRSVLNVFLSPHHYQNHRCHIGCDGIALPLAIQTELFRPVAGVLRHENRALIVGGWNKGGKLSRSILRYIQDHPETEFVSVGFPLPRAEMVPHRNLKGMAELYSGAGKLVHMPDIVCAGERVVFEAALCGAEVEMNDNVGHKSWNYDLSDTETLRETLRDAPFAFWRAVERSLRVTA